MKGPARFDGDAPVIWVSERDPRFLGLVARVKAERNVTAIPMGSKWAQGRGLFFPAAWVEAAQMDARYGKVSA